MIELLIRETGSRNSKKMKFVRPICRGIPAEVLTHAYNALVISYLCLFFYQIQKSIVLLTVHLAAVAAYIVFQSCRNRYANPLLQIGTIWIPLILLSAFHYETGLFNRVIFHDFLDGFIIYMDKTFFGFLPHLFLREQLPFELLAQLTHAFYAGFYILLIVPITLLYFNERKKASAHEPPQGFWSRCDHLREMQFVLMFTMLSCYIIAVIFPVKGPTDYHSMLFPEPRGMVSVMNYLFSNGDLDGGAMPSSHVAGALVVVIYIYKYLRGWFWAALGVFVPMTFSTVYNSYHYATDIIAGLIAGWLFYRIGRAVFKAGFSSVINYSASG
jgi:membrane-associated phospholipid phosphatase